MPNGNARYAQERPEDAGEREEALGDERRNRRSDRSSIFFGENDDGTRTPVDVKFCKDRPPKSQKSRTKQRHRGHMSAIRARSPFMKRMGGAAKMGGAIWA